MKVCRESKVSLQCCQARSRFSRWLGLAKITGLMNNLTITRRENLLALFQVFAAASIASGNAPKGLEQSFANKLQISPSMWSQIKSSRPIGDKLARQIEVLSHQSANWLDHPHAPTRLTKPAIEPRLNESERDFLQLALTLYRACNVLDKRNLSKLLQMRLESQAKAS